MSAAPQGGWDCHAHLFGPYAQYPLDPARNYTPPEALEAQYAALLARLGLQHGVLVHPSAYGTDYRLVMAALAARPAWRGVLVAQAGAPLDLKPLRAQGVRALRYSHRSGAKNFTGSASFEDLVAMAPALADAGLHAELWTDRQALPGIADAIRALPVPVVLDHMAGYDVAAGIDEPGFAALRALLAEGKAWVKLCAYRNLLALPAAQWRQAGVAHHQALVAANADQLVWGSDWPHLNVPNAPDAQDLLNLMVDWTGDALVVDKILSHNPARLYL